MNPDQQVAQMERNIGYAFNDRQLAVKALYHGGFPIYSGGAWVTPQRNERLAVLGDIVLDMLLIRKWFTTQHHPGRLSLCLHQRHANMLQVTFSPEWNGQPSFATTLLRTKDSLPAAVHTVWTSV